MEKPNPMRSTAPPWVVGTARPEVLAALVALPVHDRVADLIEARLDLAAPSPDGVHPPDLGPLLGLCQRLEITRSPVLATIRLVADGGAWTLDAERLPWFEQAARLVSWLDIEVDSRIAREVVAAAHAAGHRAIVSHHDFSGTPSLARLRAIVDRASDLGADVVKLATMVDTLDDHRTLVDLVHATRAAAGRPLAVVGMGALGTALRAYLPCIGSRLTYGYLDQAVAPGQLSARELVARLTADCPSYAELRRQRG